MKRQNGLVLVVATACVVAAMAADSTPRLNARTFQVPGSPMVVQLWDEPGGGDLVTHWSVAFDGVRFCGPRAASYEVPIRYGAFDPARGEPPVPPLLAAGDDTHVYLVQYYTQPFEQYRACVRALGGVVHCFVPNNCDLVTLPEGTLAAVQALPFVRAVRPFHPAYRIDPVILGTLQLDDPAARYSVECLDRGAAEQDAVAELVRARGGIVHFTQPNDFRMEVTCDPLSVLLIARQDGVNCIEPWPGPGEADMNIARGPAGFDADWLQQNRGMSGQGVRGEVFDTGVRQTHQAFQTPAILFHVRNGASTSHGTSTYGEVFGNGAGNVLGTGMLPNREQGIFADYTQVTQFGGAKPRSLHTAELVDPGGAYRAVFQTSSIGSALGTTYTAISAEVDDYLFQYDLLSCQSQSNSGTQNSRPQAWAKNIVSVGGFYHFDNTVRTDDRWSSGASTGPASDGRIKPDLAAFYDSILCTSDACDTCYTTAFGGTSAATPMTAGAFGLLFQMWHEGVWAGHGGGASVFADRCHMATAKALMINSAYMYKCSATDPGQPGTPAYTDLMRMRQGWGMGNVRNLAQQAPLTLVIDETDLLAPLQSRTYALKVAAGQAAFKATLVYTDPKGNPNVQTQHRINNLDLKVTAPDGTVYWGNNGMTNASWTAPGGTADTKNTVENVFVQNPAAGQWKVEVIGAEIVQDSHPATPELDADYALVVYGGTQLLVGDMNCDGLVNFADIDAFVLALSGQAAYEAQYPDCNWLNADCNTDGLVDFADIDPFVALLAG